MRILLVEVEPRLQALVSAALPEPDFQVDVCATAEEAMLRVRSPGLTYDGFLLDIVLTGLSGIELCRWLRTCSFRQPIVLLSSLGRLEDRLAAIAAGADDCLVKPFEVVELRARFQAASEEILSVGDLVYDRTTGRVTRQGIEITVSRKEAKLLEYLLKNQKRLVTRSMIAQAVWDTDTNQYSNVIDVFIERLRKKIEFPGAPGLLHSLRGKGFQLTMNPERED